VISPLRPLRVYSGWRFSLWYLSYTKYTGAVRRDIRTHYNSTSTIPERAAEGIQVLNTFGNSINSRGQESVNRTKVVRDIKVMHEAPRQCVVRFSSHCLEGAVGNRSGYWNGLLGPGDELIQDNPHMV
jgi:hypothetical protein